MTQTSWADRVPLLTLSRTYRSTRQITELGARIARTYNPDASVIGVDRKGVEVERLTGGTSPALCARVVKTMPASGHRNVALAKGLEFGGCVVVGADAGTYDPAVPFESRLLYVAASRGLHALALVAEGALHPLLVAEHL